MQPQHTSHAALVDAFTAAWSGASPLGGPTDGAGPGSDVDGTGPGAAAVPSRLAVAAARVLGTDGAGLSLVEAPLRLPLAGSDAAADEAERLQFTLGSGPCLNAAAEGRCAAVDQTRLLERWPDYARELFARTPYRAVATLPVRLGGTGPCAALDLYFTDASGVFGAGLAAALEVADQVAAVLGGTAANDPAQEVSGESWLDTGPARGRRQVWIASGMLMGGLQLGTDASVEALRTYALRQGSSLDEVAAELVSGRLDPTVVACD